jgi:hypothetical protein
MDADTGALVEELSRLREENRALAGRIEALERRGRPADDIGGGRRRGAGGAGRRISRRDLIRSAGVVAAGAATLVVADAVSAHTPADATVGTMMYGTNNHAGTSLTSLDSSTGYATFTLSAVNSDPTNTGGAFGAIAASGTAVFAKGSGVLPTVSVLSDGGGRCVDVKQTTDADAIHAATTGTGNAIYGETSGIGQAVQGNATGPGFGVVGRTASDYASGVFGSTTGGGSGVQASSTSGPAFRGGSTMGRGAVLSSGKVAQLKLTPSTAATHPTHGQRGDLFVDNQGRLWFCKKGGATATWVKVA